MNKKQKKAVKIYDTTLRDGSQAEDISFSLEDKIRIALKLDDMGVHYLEGGWPGSNPKDLQFFKEIKHYSLSHATIVCFGSTAKKFSAVENDQNIKSLLKAKTKAVTIFGKSWDIHVKESLKISLDDNLKSIFNSEIISSK